MQFIATNIFNMTLHTPFPHLMGWWLASITFVFCVDRNLISQAEFKFSFPKGKPLFMTLFIKGYVQPPISQGITSYPYVTPNKGNSCNSFHRKLCTSLCNSSPHRPLCATPMYVSFQRVACNTHASLLPEGIACTPYASFFLKPYSTGDCEKPPCKLPSTGIACNLKACPSTGNCVESLCKPLIKGLCICISKLLSTWSCTLLPCKPLSQGFLCNPNQKPCPQGFVYTLM